MIFFSLDGSDRHTSVKTKNKRSEASVSSVRRLSNYYRSLNELIIQGNDTVSSEQLASMNGVTSAQVRKDFSHFGKFGKPGLGYETAPLKRRIAKILGLDKEWNVAIVGAGNIGTALADYQEFRRNGYNIKLIVDRLQDKIGRTVKGLKVCDINDIEADLKRHRIEIVIIAVPISEAQQVADRIVKAGIKAILNFAPKRIIVPPHVVVRNENLSTELEALSFSLLNQKNKR